MRVSFYIFFLLFVSFGCSQKEDSKSSDHKHWNTVPLKYAEHFKLRQKESQFELILLDPDTKKEAQAVLISAKSSERVICLTATLVGMFCELDARNHLIGVTAENQLYDSELKQKFKKNNISAFGDFTQLSLERIAGAKPDVILYNYVNNEFPHKEKLERLGIQLVVVNDWLEAHPLAKAEWIKVIGAMTGRFEEACDLFEIIEANYTDLQNRMATITEKPSVISGNLIGNSWYAPSGENYFGILIRNAGGDYVYGDSKGAKSLALPMEKILKDNESTSVWLNPGVPSYQQLFELNPHGELLYAHTKKVFCYSANTNKFWEQSALRADYVLEDLAHIFHPDIHPDFQFHYYAPLTE